MHFGMDAGWWPSDLTWKEFLYFLTIRTKKKTLDSFLVQLFLNRSYCIGNMKSEGLKKKNKKKI